MARMRTIKPEFFTSEAVAELSLRARMTWVGLWTHCDDEGRCKDNPRLIHAAIYPLDDEITAADVAADLDELARHARIERYTVSSRHYLQVTNWHEHQKPNRPQGSKLPAPSDADPVETPAHEPRTENHGAFTENSVNDHGAVTAVAVEQWSSGAVEREQGTTPPARPRTRGTTTHKELSQSAVRPDARRLVDQWRQARPDATGYRPQTLRELSTAVDGLLRDGANPDLVRAALDEFDRRTDVHRPAVLPYLYDDAVKAARAATAPTQPPQSASQTGRSKRDEKALGWLSLADKLAAEEGATVSPLFADLPAIEGTTA